MTDKSPHGESQGRIASLRDVFLRLGFEVGPEFIKFTQAQKISLKRGRRRQVGEKLHSVTTINRWQLNENEPLDISLTIDMELFQDNLRDSVTRFFGTKAEAEVHLRSDGVLDIAVLVTQPGTKTTERGYLNLPREDDLPIGCFGFKLKFISCSDGMCVQMQNVFGLGFLPSDFLLSVEDWLFVSFGIEGICQPSWKRSHFSEFIIHIDSLVLSAVGAKDTERRQAADLLKKWRELNPSRQDYRVEWELEDPSLLMSSLQAGERRALQNISVGTLEIKEMIRQYPTFENAFIAGQWNTVNDLINAEKNAEKNTYFGLRSALMLLMANFPTKYRGVVEIAKRAGDSIEALSAKLRVSDNPSERLAILSKMTTYVLERFDFAEASRGIGLVFSEYLGDLWSYEDIDLAVECYDRALEIDQNAGRLLRKKKAIYTSSKQYEKAISVLEILISVEPRRVEISKLMIEKGGYLLDLGRTRDAIAVGELAVSNDRLSPKAALFLATALRLNGQFAESVQSLDDLLCLDNGLLSARQKAELNTVIGETWLNDLNSPEIAASRLKTAVDLDSESELAHRLLAECLERTDRFEEQIKILEKYLVIAEKLDDQDAINWAQDKIAIQSLEVKELSATQRVTNLRRALSKDRMNASQIIFLLENSKFPEDWNLITSTLSQRVMEIESAVERGMIYEMLARGARDYLNDLSLSQHFFLKAWEMNYLSEEVFQANYDRYSKTSNNLGLAKLCEAWIEQDFPNRILLLRDCVDRELPISALTIDRLLLQAVDVNPENVDIAIRRLQQLIRIDNSLEVVKIWTSLVELGLGLIRRRRVFNYIKDYLIEKGLFHVLLDAYLGFSLKSDDQTETLKEAIEVLDGNVEDVELGILIRQCILANYLPFVPHERLLTILNSYPTELKKYFLLKANHGSKSREALSDLISAMNVNDPSRDRSIDLSIDKMIEAFIRLPEQSEWFGIENLKSMVYAPKHAERFINYLAWWIPKIDFNERISGTHILLDLLSLNKKTPDEALHILDEIINLGDQAILSERIANILMAASRANRSYRIKLLIESNKPSKDAFLELASGLAPEAFGQSLVDIFELMTAFNYTSFEKINFYIDTKIYSHFDAGRLLDEAVREYLLESLNTDEDVFRFWFCHESFSHITHKLISGIFNLQNNHKTDSKEVLLNLSSFLPEVCEDWTMMQNASVWILHQLERVSNQDVVKKIFFSLNPTLLTHPVECIQAFLISKKIGDLMRARFYADQIYQALEAGRERLIESVRDYYSENTLSQVLDEINDLNRESNDGTEQLDPNANPDLEISIDQTDSNVLAQLQSDSKGHIGISFLNENSIERAHSLPDDPASDKTSLSQAPTDPSLTDSDEFKTVFSNDLPTDHAATQMTIVKSESPSEWREFIKMNRLGFEHVELIRQSEVLPWIEQHIAIQALALTAGQVHCLGDWKWNVWRDRNKMEYPLAVQERFPEHAVSSSLIGPLANFLKEIYPMVVMNLWEKCSLGGLSNSAGLTEDQLVSRLRQIEWNHPFFVEAGIGFLSDRFEATGYQVYDFGGIRDRVWLDASRRWIVIDLEYFRTLPPSVLFFAFLSKHWEIMARFQVYLDSNPSFEAFPVIKIIYEYFLDLFGLGFSNAPETEDAAENPVFSLPRQVLDTQAEHVNRDRLKLIVAELPTLSESDFLNQQFKMRSHIHRLCLAESLDLVGLVEFLTKRNILDKPPQSLIELISLSRYIQPLLKFTLQMNLI